MERALITDPLWAEGAVLQIELLRNVGRPIAALRAYREYEARLEREPGVEPDAEMRALVERVMMIQ